MEAGDRLPRARTGDTLGVDVITAITIDRPLSEVAAYAGDPSNAPVWYANIDSVEWRTPPPLAIGSRLAFVARFLGRRLETTYEILDLVPDARLAMRTAEGPFPMPAAMRRANRNDNALLKAEIERGAGRIAP